MKTLYFIRHGKAAITSTSGNDADRMLTDVGVERTKRVADYIADTDPEIDLIISSPAERAYATALIISDRLGISGNKMQAREHLFLGDADVMIEMIQNLDETVNKVMIVGHNPVISKVARRFEKRLNDLLPTTGVVSVHVNTDTWANLEQAEVIHNFTVWPGML